MPIVGGCDKAAGRKNGGAGGIGGWSDAEDLGDALELGVGGWAWGCGFADDLLQECDRTLADLLDRGGGVGRCGEAEPRCEIVERCGLGVAGGGVVDPVGEGLPVGVFSGAAEMLLAPAHGFLELGGRPSAIERGLWIHRFRGGAFGVDRFEWDRAAFPAGDGFAVLVDGVV